MFELKDENKENDIENKIKTSNDELETKLKIQTTEASKTAASEAVSLAMKELDTKLGGTGTGSKIAEIIRKAKKSGGKEPEEISCPNCSSNEHDHKLKDVGGGKLKCTGEDCQKEYALISTLSDYKCETCGTPHARPKKKEDEENDSCPFCGGNSFIRPEISYDKIREKVSKKLLKKSDKTNKESKKWI